MGVQVPLRAPENRYLRLDFSLRSTHQLYSNAAFCLVLRSAYLHAQGDKQCPVRLRGESAHLLEDFTLQYLTV